MRRKKNEDRKVLSASLRTGAVALVFMALGFQLALFVHRAAMARIISNRDSPDTVYVTVGTSVAADGPSSQSPPGIQENVFRKNSDHSPAAEKIRSETPRRNVETFRFNPNTVSVEDLQRLGFSPKQAAAIDNYRRSGGRYRRRGDFAKSFVVEDSVFRRLEKFIDIPLVDLNRADSAALDDLPGIGGWFARQIIAHREELGGYSRKEQLMDIYHFDREKYDALKDLVTVSHPKVLELWTLPADSLRKHPAIRNWQTAKGIVLFRENNPVEKWSVEALRGAGVLTDDQALRLSRCLIAPPANGGDGGQ